MDDTRPTVWDWLKASCGTPADRTNQWRIIWWSVAWAIAYLVATHVLESSAGVIAWLTMALPAIVGIGVVAAFVRFLRETDEFTRSVQLEGLAVGFAVGVGLLLGYGMLESVGAPALDTPTAAVVMLLCWSAGVLVATFRYR